MKKYIIVVTLFTLLLSLAACSSSASTPAASKTTSLSTEAQLLVGTLKLESTALVVSKAQAAQLLPLWETLQSLASSGTAAQAEVDAVVDQIKSTMTAQQLSSINTMNLTNQDLTSAMAESGTSTTASTMTGSATSSSAQLPSGGGMAAPAGGDPGGGNPPTDMGGAMSASGSTSSIGIAQAASAQSTVVPSSVTSNQVPPALINALVELLQKKVA